MERGEGEVGGGEGCEEVLRGEEKSEKVLGDLVEGDLGDLGEEGEASSNCVFLDDRG